MSKITVLGHFKFFGFTSKSNTAWLLKHGGSYFVAYHVKNILHWAHRSGLFSVIILKILRCPYLCANSGIYLTLNFSKFYNPFWNYSTIKTCINRPIWVWKYLNVKFWELKLYFQTLSHKLSDIWSVISFTFPANWNKFHLQFCTTILQLIYK